LKKRSDLIWTLIGLGAVVLSCFLLYRELRNISLGDIADSLRAIPTSSWLMASTATCGAYWALAWYDRIAIAHLGKRIPWRFITLCSFTTYALAHNIGASVFSGAMVRYRAYRTKGLSPHEIGILIVFCSLTFALGTLLTGGCVLVLQPSLIQRLVEIPPPLSVTIGGALLSLVALYVLGSWRRFKPWTLGKLHIEYPSLPIVGRQLLAGPLELLCAAAIIYFALPAENSPGYLTVLGVFLASFSLALLSHAPGGLGVLEVTFLAALPELDPADVLAALLVFRGFYLLIPFVLSLLVVLGFEWSQWQARRDAAGDH
jgi:uncharacterized membrane protein YbhN (UPF0104 family)